MGNLFLDSEEQPTEGGAGAASAEADEEMQHVQHEIDGINVLRYEAMDQVMEMLPKPFLLLNSVHATVPGTSPKSLGDKPPVGYI